MSKLLTVSAYIRTEYQAGRFPNVTIDGVAGEYWLCDGDYVALNGRHYKSKESALSARSKLLDRNRAFIGA